MKKKLLTFVLAAAMVLSMPTALFAAEAQSEKTADTPTVSEGNEIAPRSASSVSAGASRKSSTSGSVSAYASFNTKASKATCTITLQVKSNGTWKTATDLPVYSYVKTASNVYSLSTSKTFTLKSGKVYRAKVMVSDTNSSGTHFTTKYTGSF